jgi:excisionase family DNA binding protein
MSENVYTTFQVAALCRVQPSTVIKWANQNLLLTYTTPGGHRRIKETDLLNFIKQYRIPVPDELQKPVRRVLVVDDEKDIGQLVVRAFRKAAKGVEAEWIQDGVEALLSVGKNPPDLIILDVIMPNVDGCRVLATLRSDPRTQKVKVVGITGQPHLAPDKLGFMRRHTDAFFFKPFTIKELVCESMSLMGLPVPVKIR